MRTRLFSLLLGLCAASAAVAQDELGHGRMPAVCSEGMNDYLVGNVSRVIVLPIDGANCQLKITFPTREYSRGTNATCNHNAKYMVLSQALACNSPVLDLYHKTALTALTLGYRLYVRTQSSGGWRNIQVGGGYFGIEKGPYVP